MTTLQQLRSRIGELYLLRRFEKKLYQLRDFIVHYILRYKDYPFETAYTEKIEGKTKYQYETYHKIKLAEFDIGDRHYLIYIKD
jgi:hypothetical protein